jgi:hypothetical protein
MATDYGFDTACVTDTGLVDEVITSPMRVIGERVARRLTTDRNGLAAVDPLGANGGWNIRQLLLGRISPASLAQGNAQIKAEAEKDEEVQNADVDVIFVNGGALTITLRLLSAFGPFTLTMNVSQASYSILVAGP